MKAPGYLRAASAVLLRVDRAVLALFSVVCRVMLLLWGVGIWRTAHATGSSMGVWLSGLTQHLPASVRTQDLISTLRMFFLSYDRRIAVAFLVAGAVIAASVLLALLELFGMLRLARGKDGTRPLRGIHAILALLSLGEIGACAYLGVRLYQFSQRPTVQTLLSVKQDIRYALITLGALLALTAVMLVVRACWHKDICHLLKTIHGDLSALGGQPPRGHLFGVSILLSLLLLPAFAMMVIGGLGSLEDLQQLKDAFSWVQAYLPEFYPLAAPWASLGAVTCLVPPVLAVLQLGKLWLTAACARAVRTAHP